MKVALYTLGCKLNQAETESLASQFSEAGYQLVASKGIADIYIVNTCTVTHVADRKSRHWLRLARRRNPKAFIIATGCYAQRAPQELIPLSNLVLNNKDKERLLEIINNLPLRTSLSSTARNYPSSAGNDTARVRSLIKIQDGCHTACTYCIVPRVRSLEYSLPVSQIIEEIKTKETLGYKEVILTGTKVGCYSNANMTLSDLIQLILNSTGIERLRLSSLQPQEVSPKLLALWQNKRLCRHLHLALQSGSDAILQKMKRNYSLDDYIKAIYLIKEAIPGAAITTDIMVGFPGESEDDFQQSYRFCQQETFANIHVFPFSPRPGTQAARMPDQIKEQVKKERSQRMLELARQCREKFYEQSVGNKLPVLWEKETAQGNSIYSGLTDNYIRVSVHSHKPLTNEILPVKLVKLDDQGMWGEPVSENSS